MLMVFKMKMLRWILVNARVEQKGLHENRWYTFEVARVWFFCEKRSFDLRNWIYSFII